MDIMGPDPQRGQLRLAAPPPGTDGNVRLVLVLRVVGHVAEVALVHTSPELATSYDVLVPASAAGTPYGVVVQSDLRGLVSVGQLGRVVGALAERTLSAASAALATSAPHNGVGVGVPLLGPDDRRWTFKAAEGRDLDALTGPATAAALAGS